MLADQARQEGPTCEALGTAAEARVIRLEHAIERASSAPGPKSAAGLYNEIEYELTLGEPDDHLERAGEQALALFENRFSGVRAAAREIEEPPALSRQAGVALHGIGGPPPPHWSARLSRRHFDRRVRRSRSWLFANVRAHPVAAIATVTVSIIVIVHFWAYIVLGPIALCAIKACGA